MKIRTSDILDEQNADLQQPQAEVNTAKKQLIGLSREELKNELASLGEKPFRTKQVWNWIYNYGAQSFDEMTNLSKELRNTLKESYTIERPKIVKDLISSDSTRKWLIEFGKGKEAETVHIPEEDRGALCVSSQVGCTLNCTFCHTGTQPWVKNLTPYDIVSQMLIARDRQKEWPSTRTPRLLSNIVFMGMGEPLLNYDNVAKAIRILTDEEGIAISKRRINVSTSGIVPRIEQMGNELDVGLAISLHAVSDDLRDILVPINKKYPLKELVQACRNYPAARNSRRITWEYVMLKGINDSEADAKELLRLIRGMPSIINLIPFNPWPGSGYECSDEAQIKKFADIILKAGYPTPVRTPRGQDIMAACGQLKSESIRQRKLAS